MTTAAFSDAIHWIKCTNGLEFSPFDKRISGTLDDLDKALDLAYAGLSHSCSDLRNISENDFSNIKSITGIFYKAEVRLHRLELLVDEVSARVEENNRHARENSNSVNLTQHLMRGIARSTQTITSAINQLLEQMPRFEKSRSRINSIIQRLDSAIVKQDMTSKPVYPTE